MKPLALSGIILLLCASNSPAQLDLPNSWWLRVPGTAGSIDPWAMQDVKGLVQIPTEGLKAHWPFNGNADDESGNGNNGVVFGAQLTTDRFGIPNTAYEFGGSGVNEWIQVNNTEAFRLTSWTISVWMKADVPLWGAGVLAKENDSNSKYNFGMALFGTGEIASQYESCDSENDHYVITNPIITGAWYFITMVRDETTGNCSVYINSQLEASATYTDTPCANSTRFFIGNTGVTFDGVLDDIRIYDRPLSPDEILELYNESPYDPLAQPGICYGSTGSGDPTNPGALLTIDPLTGAGTLVGPTGIIGDQGPAVPVLAIKSTGEIYTLSASSSSSLYTINASTGAGTYVATTGLASPDALAFDQNDILYAVANSNNLYTVNLTTGVPTFVAHMATATKAMAYDPSDGAMYGSSGNDQIFTINLTTGATTAIGATGLGGSTHALRFDQEGNLFGTKGSATLPYTLISIDKATGAGTTIGEIGFSAVLGLSSRVAFTPPANAVTVDVAIDSLLKFIPAKGDTIPYTVTLVNHTSQTQVVDWWTKVLRPGGNPPIDPLSGPTVVVLNRFQTSVIDTPLLPVPYNAIEGDYSLIAFIGDYPADTLGSDTTDFHKLPAIPCSEISTFQARCRPGGIIQARIILSNANHTGDPVIFSIDEVPYGTTVTPNRRAVISLSGFNPGSHTVELTEPAGCFAPIDVFCPVGSELAGNDFWEDELSWEVPAATVLFDNYPNPFNPSTTFRYGLSEPGQVSLKIYNMIGQLVKTVVSDYQTEGYHEVKWDGRNERGGAVASGIYVYRLVAGSFVEMRRMVLMK